MSNNVRERLADVQHAIWAHWMRYQFSVCQPNGDGSVTIPADKVERWSRQMKTIYADLTEKERESDRDQADKIILSIRHLLEGATLAEVYGPRLEAAELELSHLRPEWQAVTAERDAAVKRAEAAEARVKELEVQLTGILPAAQVLVSKVEFIPIPTSNAGADSALLTGAGETSNGGMWKQIESATHP